MVLRIAHQGKAAGKNASVRERAEQLAAMGDAGLKLLRRGCKRAPRALGQAQDSFTVAHNRRALRLRIGEL